ncbi:MAG: hypothetical protein K2N56_02740 [Oscillospiraceae bacterium]|nr:hypothetical protein [Oscillospiraceae bacterium]
MKRIIAFVLLGLLIYAGAYIIYYAASEMKIKNAVPIDINNINSGNVHTWTIVEGSIYQVMKEYKTEKTQPKMFGVPYGEPIEKHYYILPLGTSYMYIMLEASDEQDLEIIEQMRVVSPREYVSGGITLDVRCVAERMPKKDFDEVKTVFMKDTTLLGERPLVDYISEPDVTHHIIPYVLHIRHPQGDEHIPLAIGIAVCVVGVGLTVLLILRIKGEREGY